MRQGCLQIIFRTLAVCFTLSSFSNLFHVSRSPFADMAREMRYDGPILLTSGKLEIIQNW
jgi:hypothetical protein